MSIEELKKEKVILEKAIKSAREKISDLENEVVAEKAKPGHSLLAVTVINEKIEDTKASIQRLERALKINSSKIRGMEAKKLVEENLLNELPVLDKLQADSKALLLHLKSAQQPNERLLNSARLREEIREKTGRRLYYPGISVGFKSLNLLIEILESELAGKGRRLFKFSQLPQGKDRI